MKIEYECSGPGKVSVWCGYLGSKGNLSKYTDILYTDDGDAYSLFLNEFPIVDFDEDFTEKFYFENKQILFETLPMFSYAETFIEKIAADLETADTENFDSIFFVYDCDASFMKDIQDTKMKLLGVYDY